MKTINLDSTTDSIELKLGGAVATNQLQWTSHRYDTTVATGVVLEGKTTGTSNDTTAVTVVAAPASGHTRTLKEVSVYNADTTSSTIIIQFNDNSNVRIMCKKTLASGASCALTDGATTSTGDVVGPGSSTDGNIAVFDGTTGKLIKDGGATIASKANTASPTFTGTVTLPKTVLGEESFQLDPTLSANGKRSGITKTGTAGATLTFGQLCYFTTGGKRVPVDGILDGTDTGFNKKLGMCILAASGDGEATEMLEYGYIYATAFPTLTVGSPAYASDTAGEIVVAQPSTTNFAIRIVGFGETADVLLFNPSPDYIVHT